MIRVGFIGTVGVGKDTAGRRVANKLAAYSPKEGKFCKVRHIQEFSVLWTDQTGGTTELFEQYYIFQRQRVWDHDYDSRMNDPFAFVICSAPAPLAYFYTLAFADVGNIKHRKLLKDLYEDTLEELLQYDKLFHLPVQFSIPEGDRLRKNDIRQSINASIPAFLLQHRIPYTTLTGNEEEISDCSYQELVLLLKERPLN